MGTIPLCQNLSTIPNYRYYNYFPTLKWLRVSMSYHHFQNLRELFQGDLNATIIKGIGSLTFQDLPCNCRKKCKWAYSDNCRNKIVVYQATCLITGKNYIGNTQQHVKSRMQQPTQDTKKLVCDDRKTIRSLCKPLRPTSSKRH